MAGSCMSPRASKVTAIWACVHGGFAPVHDLFEATHERDPRRWGERDCEKLVAGTGRERRTPQRNTLLNWHVYRAGDENRTRTISLGICVVSAVLRPDLRGRLSAGNRDGPFFTGVNGTLMARRSWPQRPGSAA